MTKIECLHLPIGANLWSWNQYCFSLYMYNARILEAAFIGISRYSKIIHIMSDGMYLVDMEQHVFKKFMGQMNRT